jgi:4'-phosphopantetheinyl transferase EntD
MSLILAHLGARDAAALGTIIPRGIAFCEYPSQTVDTSLRPAEIKQIVQRKMSTKRQVEFARGRACARRAMAHLGYQDEDLLIGTSRAPMWPKGLVGSITHCESYCAAAVARTTDLKALGIDAEIWEEFPIEVCDEIVEVAELNASAFSLSPSPLQLALIFSAKESIFKAINPLIQRFFDFRSVRVQVDFTRESFSIYSTDIDEIKKLSPSLRGRFIITGPLVLTSAIIMSR